MFDWDDLPEPDYEKPSDPPGAYVNGRWVDAEDLPMGWGRSPDWWDDEGYGETFEEYMEHTD